MKSPPPQITLLTGWELIESLIASGPFLPNPFFRFLPLSEAKSTLGDSLQGCNAHRARRHCPSLATTASSSAWDGAAVGLHLPYPQPCPSSLSPGARQDNGPR